MKWYLYPDGIEFPSWNPKEISRKLIGHKPTVSLSNNEPQEGFEIGDKKLVPLVDTRPSIEKYQVITERLINIDGLTASISYTISDKNLDEYKEERKTEAWLKRKQRETSGITVGGIFIPTDDKTQARVDQIAKAYDDGDITGTIDFETPFGFVTIDKQTLKAIKKAGALHIQECFSKQKDHYEAIEACATVQEVAAIDLDS